MSAQDLLAKTYKGKTFQEMSRRDFFVAILELITNLTYLTPEDAEYNKTLADLGGINSIDIAKPIPDAQLEAEKIKFLEKLIFVGQKSDTKSKALSDLLA